MYLAGKWIQSGALLLVAFFWFAPRAKANVTVLLEEPYSYDGAFAGTGHTALYFDRVCAETPVKLRRCASGERGAVISRYTRIAGYVWLAMPRVPYLYAVENPEDIPLYADPKLEVFLRDQYRRAHLEALAPDGPDGETPKGDWYELVGSSYDRTNYGFEIETTPEQDDAFIAWLNAQPNRAVYDFVTRNCADFVRAVLNFYYPQSESRANLADLFVSTPKHDARSLVRYSKRHPELEFTTFAIPQVPGTVRRSKPVRGVLESVFRAKKYVAVLAVFHPVIAGGVISVYVVGDRFNPAKNARVFSLDGEPVAPPTDAERRAYLKELQRIAVMNAETDESAGGTSWRKWVAKSDPEMDAAGQAGFEVRNGQEIVELGVTRRELPSEGAPWELQRGLLVARLKQTLARSRAPRISSGELREDWQLLQKIDDAEHAQLSKRLDGTSRPVSPRVERTSD